MIAYLGSAQRLLIEVPAQIHTRDEGRWVGGGGGHLCWASRTPSKGQRARRWGLGGASWPSTSPGAPRWPWLSRRCCSCPVSCPSCPTWPLPQPVLGETQSRTAWKDFSSGTLLPSSAHTPDDQCLPFIAVDLDFTLLVAQ